MNGSPFASRPAVPEPSSPRLAVDRLSHVYPTAEGALQVLENISFTVQPQEFVCVVGPSGCGKSTLLKLLAGLFPPSEGTLFFEGAPLAGPSRRIGLVFQKANLMPWRTALANVRLPLELAGVPAADADARAQAALLRVGLAGFEHSLPRDLSGGMEQRVALARALAQDPDLLLLDEPFGALDALNRERLGAELLRLWEARRITVVMVTHSIPEALLLSDRVLALTPRPGQVRLALDVPLPRPRRLEMEHSPEFGELARRLRAAIS
ncbi:MAG: ABC transporter ATP-binding protein [Anaerolineales bacterium]|nr:ABC transporter ATP-binding protein [Anaerolineales bacterium]